MSYREFFENQEVPLSADNEGVYFETLKEGEHDYRIVNTPRYGAGIIVETDAAKLENEAFLWRLNQRHTFGNGEFSTYCFKCLGCPMDYCVMCNQEEVMLYVLNDNNYIAKTRYCLHCNSKRGPLMYGDWARFVHCDHYGAWTEKIGCRTPATDLAYFVTAKSPKKCPFCFETNCDYRGNAIAASYYCWDCNKNFWKFNDMVELRNSGHNSYAAIIAKEDKPEGRDTLTWLTDCCNVKQELGHENDLFIWRILQREIEERLRVYPILKRIRSEALAADNDYSIHPDGDEAVVVDEQQFEWGRMWEST